MHTPIRLERHAASDARGLGRIDERNAGQSKGIGRTGHRDMVRAQGYTPCRMSFKRSEGPRGERIVPVTIHLEDPEGATGTEQKEWTLTGATGESLLELALDQHINIEHACGGVCACSTCHIYVEEGMECLSESTEAEDDRVEEAPGIQRNSRLACQCEIKKAGRIVIRVPSWNRNAVKEVPH
ncbi:MAG: 2Fe-2S iron-sulfur cluster binding domain-containing protein [Phycisphaerae bacterium]|nr:2Fe-2S iron-sulfur cluster binding domain-containing protein [Phycisphaerae bacterium]